MTRNGLRRLPFVLQSLAMMAMQAAGIAVCAGEPQTPAQRVSTVQTRQLLAEGFPGKEWVYFAGKKDARLEETWTVNRAEQDPVLICRGEPHGYIRTAESYTDFQLGLEWKYPKDDHGNSGILLFTSGEDKLWPNAIQVQLHQPTTGSILASGRAQLTPVLVTKTQYSRGRDKWNDLVLTSQKGKVSLQINGKDVGEVNVATPREGSIGLQSEGSEVHFRKIWIKDLHPAAPGMTALPPCVPCRPNPVIIPRANAAPQAYVSVDKLHVSGKRVRVVSRRVLDVNDVADGIPLAAHGAARLPGGHFVVAGGDDLFASRRDVRRADRSARHSADSR